MENKEFAFKGTVMNGFLALFINIVVMVLAIAGIVYSIITLDNYWRDPSRENQEN